MSRESVAGHIMRLTRSGHILGKGYLVAQDKAMLIIGASNVDIQGHPSDQFYAGDSSQGHIRQSAGGVARNIAENLQRLGVSCRLLTVVGQDQAGDWMLETLSHCGIETRDIWRLAEWPTSRYLSIQNDQGELVAAIADMRILDTLTPHLLQQKHKLLQAAPTILLDANLPEATLEWLAQQPLTATLYADAVSATKAPRLRAILPKLQLLKVNVAEAKALLSTHITDPDTLAQQLLASGVQQI
jgi:pseudouridine kinase